MSPRRSGIERSVREILAGCGVSRIIATVSGGPDSMALLSALAAVKGCSVLAAHCNFHLRGEESDRDCGAVEDACHGFGIPLVVRDFDVAGYMSSRKGVSAEMACRDLRYGWFRALMAEHDMQRIATGHNANDNIETFLLNMLRGAGSSGLKAMVPDTGEIIRPLLTFTRKEILEYLEEKGVGYVTDSTNLESDYRRNFLRNEVIPLFRSRWEGFDTALASTIRHIGSENKIVAKALADVMPPVGMPLGVDVILRFPAPELLVRRFVEPALPFTATASEIIAAIKAGKPDVRRWHLRKGTVRLQGGKLYVETAENKGM